jgi:hypothetical protein
MTKEQTNALIDKTTRDIDADIEALEVRVKDLDEKAARIALKQTCFSIIPRLQELQQISEFRNHVCRSGRKFHAEMQNQITGYMAMASR